ncbi:hypothetical protein [Geoalkalibacter sp.]|uniref:hypothetical protein n=1 Tax=Geoalkalibacter sp. TaxID=3041440 RepID=UPI00272EC28C|nr:hypothetical protein [Geoalkalibacter sp.]
MSEKHFNAGNVFGRVVDEIERKTSQGGKEFISFAVSVAGRKCGGVKAYCRMWDAERFEPFLDALSGNPGMKVWLRGYFGQYWNDKNEVMSNFTMFEWSERDSEPRAAFILKGVVDQAQKVRLGQRLLLTVARDGAPKAETFELWCPAERLLDEARAGELIEVKGYVRQETPEDDYGGSGGPVRAYVDQLRVCA